MYLYLILNISIIIIPFLLSFERKVAFWRKWGRFLGSFLIVGTSFILWDIYATWSGHWSFNDKYLVGVDFLGIPLEEMLFFFTVPYACLFTYEAVGRYSREWKVRYKPWPYHMVGLVLFALGIVYLEQGYTSLVLIETGILVFIIPFLAPWIPGSRRYWIYVLVTLGLFIIFNMVLTAVPVVRYGSGNIWGGNGSWNGRFFTIPLEDFIYNVSMVTWYLLVYLLIDRCLEERKHKKIQRGTPESGDDI
jgi:lycopene cyclase domain-containing protein